MSKIKVACFFLGHGVDYIIAELVKCLSCVFYMLTASY